MRNRIYGVITVFGMVFALAIANAQGQTPNKVNVSIPFEFSAGRTTLKSGVYSIRRTSADFVTLRSEDGKFTTILNAPVTLLSTDPKAVERLVFEKYGERYFLSQIWLTADTGRQVWIQKKGLKSERVEIALRAK